MNRPSIYVRNAGSNEPWTTPDTTTYEWESDLQELLATEPSRIEGVPDGSMAVRELSTSAGPVDICVVSPDGDITVVECKLQRSSEPRRMVLKQVIDYASAVHINGRAAFHHAWKSRGGPSLESLLDPDSLENLSENIKLGRIHLALAVDRIDDNLRRLIELLNLISRDDIRGAPIQLS